MQRARLTPAPDPVVVIPYDVRLIDDKLRKQVPGVSGYALVVIAGQGHGHALGFYYNRTRKRARVFDPNFGEFWFDFEHVADFFSLLNEAYGWIQELWIFRCQASDPAVVTGRSRTRGRLSDRRSAGT